MYILVLNSVFIEYELYRNNRDNKTIKYSKAGSENIFRLLDDIISKRRNNPIYQFNHYSEIEIWLREQWAGLFRELLNRRSEHKQLATLTERMDELASINSSLQRYMEAVVSSVSASPQEAKEIIKEEKDRLISEKLRRDFERSPMIESLMGYGVSFETAEAIFRLATSIEEVAEKTAPLIGSESGYIIKHWKERPHLVSEINDARTILGLDPLHFAKTASKVKTRTKKET